MMMIRLFKFVLVKDIVVLGFEHFIIFFSYLLFFYISFFFNVVPRRN